MGLITVVMGDPNAGPPNYEDGGQNISGACDNYFFR